MKKFFKKYIIPYWLAILIFVISFLIFYIRDFFILIIGNSDLEISTFRIQLVATFLGVGVSIAAVVGNEHRKQRSRRNKTFGLLRLVVVPYLDKQHRDFSMTMKNVMDICEYHQAIAFLELSSHFDKLGENYDVNWFQLIYSQEFLDFIKKDSYFNKIANVISEVLLFKNHLVSNSLKAKHLLIGINNIAKYNQPLDLSGRKVIVKRTKDIRNQLISCNDKFKKYLEKLKDELDKFLEENGIRYEEFER